MKNLKPGRKFLPFIFLAGLLLIPVVILLPKSLHAEITTVRDWVGLFPLGALDGKTTAVDWKYTSSCTQTPGTIPKTADPTGCSFSAPAQAGLYEYRLYANDGEDSEALLATSNHFSIGFDFNVAKDGSDNWVCSFANNSLTVTLKWPALPAGGVDKVTLVRSTTGSSQKTYINAGSYSPSNLTYEDVVSNPASSYTYYGIASSGTLSAESAKKVQITNNNGACVVAQSDHNPPVASPNPSSGPLPGINCQVQSTNARVNDGLISSSAVSSQFGSSTGYCVIDPANAPFAPYRIASYESIKSDYFDKSRLGSTQKITLTGNQTQGSTTSPISLSTGGAGGSPVGWWKLDEISGTTAADSSGNNRNGTVNGATWTAGKYNNGLSFDPPTSTDVVTINNGETIAPLGSNRTVTLWFKPLDSGNQRGIMSQGDSSRSTTPRWILVRRANNLLSVYHGGNYRDSSATLAANNWYHVAYTFEGGVNKTVKLYLDGNTTPVYNWTDSILTDSNAGTNIYIGDGYNASFYGIIDDVKIFNYAMTPTQVQNDYLGSTSSTDKLYHITTDGVTPGDLTISSNITVDKTGIIFVDGNLNINTNLTHTSNSAGLVFVVKGNVNIASTVTRIDAVIISTGSIYTAGAGCTTNSVTAGALTIYGSLISLDANDKIKLCRTLANNNAAAEIVKQQPKYLVILRDLYAEILQKWSEIQ